MTSTMSFIGSKEVAAQFVDDLLWRGKLDYQSITITKRVKSADFCVHIAIDGSSEDTVEMLAQNYSNALTLISQVNT